jgi:hypothetical protein
MLTLQAQQSVTLAVTEQSIPIYHYLRQPRRLVHALVNPHQVSDLGDGVFRLRMRTVTFLMLHIQPVVDLALRVRDNGRISLQSVGCELQGNPFINQHFELELWGYLQPCPQGGGDLAIGYRSVSDSGRAAANLEANAAIAVGNHR